MNRFFVFIFVFIFALPCLGHSKILLVDDFNDASKPNFIGGDFGSWNKDSNDPTQSCIDSFSEDIRNGDSGYALKLDYDVDSPNPAYNGFWMSLNNVDLRQYNTLIFYITGDKLSNFTKRIKVELKGANGEVGRFLLENIQNDWQKIVIPFHKFKGLTNWSKVVELIFVFDDANATEKDGVLYFDDISFQTL